MYPDRFFGAPERSRRIGRVLRLAARVDELDEELVDRIGRRMFTRDEPGARLVRAMGREVPAEQRVTMAQFARALDDGVPPDAPAALREFFAEVERTRTGWTPSWWSAGRAPSAGWGATWTTCCCSCR
ncbi:hypothetical protein [Saccharopolyspora gregorii]|uniref:Uncharacterized protein n=1 Tax=Saccharopolyspora gregorii TaxID=33914 RepID=A0ABP6RLR9_9PSEU